MEREETDQMQQPSTVMDELTEACRAAARFATLALKDADPSEVAHNGPKFRVVEAGLRALEAASSGAANLARLIDSVNAANRHLEAARAEWLRQAGVPPVRSTTTSPSPERA